MMREERRERANYSLLQLSSSDLDFIYFLFIRDHNEYP
jgi:hypothetical protein